MEISSHQKYYLSLEGDEKEFDNFNAVQDHLISCLELEEGKINLSALDSLRPWWQRFIFGLKNYVRGYFAVEWHGDVAALMFYDENMSEFRVKNINPLSVSEAVRTKISFGEEKPLKEKYCLTKKEAIKAINELLTSGEKPNWIECDFVE